MVEGRLTPETKLPSKRKLSIHLGISQTTVETAYQQLIAEGYVKSEPRKGLFVTELEMDMLPIKQERTEVYNPDQTFSKSLIPSLRISFMVLPPPLLSRYQNRFSIYKQTVSRLHQQTLYLFMKEGHWSRHLQKMRTTYRRKQSTLLSLITEKIGQHVTVIGVDSGLHILLEVHNNMNESQLISYAEKAGVRVYPTSVYYDSNTQPITPKVLIGYGGVTENEIHTGIKLLQTAWELF
jgi:DNA-binding transcriptional MocR family regulator